MVKELIEFIKALFREKTQTVLLIFGILAIAVSFYYLLFWDETNSQLGIISSFALVLIGLSFVFISLKIKFNTRTLGRTIECCETPELKYIETSRLDIEKSHKVGEKYLYLDYRSAKRWADYEYYTIGTYKIPDEIKQSIFNASKSKSVSYISLGCGTGRKDMQILEYITSEVKSEINYNAIEVSLILLETALETISSNPKIVTKGIKADFEKLESLSEKFLDKSEIHIFSILGNTFGNYDESSLTTKIINCMKQCKNSFLLLEVSSSGAELDKYEDGYILRDGKYSNEDYINFIKGPMTDLGLNGELEFVIHRVENFGFNRSRVYANFYTTNESGQRDGQLYEITHSTHYKISEINSFLSNCGLKVISCKESGKSIFIFCKI